MYFKTCKVSKRPRCFCQQLFISFIFIRDTAHISIWSYFASFPCGAWERGYEDELLALQLAKAWDSLDETGNSPGFAGPALT
jgi:hypothetical protein